MPSKIASYIWDGCLATFPPFGKITAQGRVEIFREADIHLGLFFNYFSLGTLLSLATLITGLTIIMSIKKNEQNN